MKAPASQTPTRPRGTEPSVAGPPQGTHEPASDSAPGGRNDWELDELVAQERVAQALFGRSQPLRLGRFEIERRLGRGGMGEVWLAVDPRLGRHVALKMLRADLVGGGPGPAPGQAPGRSRSEAQAQLLAEAQTLARLNHPHTVTVHDVIELEGRVVIVEEYVQGAALHHWLREHDPPMAARMAVLEACTQGLMAAHEAGVAHLDFKPANVLVRADQHALVADFGLARALGSQAHGGGTRAFAAPEQWARRGAPVRVDVRADQWSLAATICATLGKWAQWPTAQATGQLTGQAPDQLTGEATGQLVGDDPGPSELEAYQQRVQAAVASCALSRARRQALLRALSHAPADRYEDLRAFAHAFFEQPRRRRQRARLGGALAGSLAIGGALAAFVLPADPEPAPKPCNGVAASQWLGQGRADHEAWAPERASAWLAQVQAADPTWAASARTAARRLGQQRAELEALWPQVCMAQASAATPLGAQRRCAEARRIELAQFGEQLQALRGDDLAKAPALARALPAVSDCRLRTREASKATDTQVGGTTRSGPSPDLAAQVEAVHRHLAQAQAHMGQGQLDAAGEGLDLAKQAAQAAGQKSLLARVDLAQARLQAMRGELEAGLALAEAAYFTAVAEGAELLAVDIAMRLAKLSARGGHKSRQAERWLRQASASLQQLGGDTCREVLIAAFKGDAALEDHDIATSLAHYTEALNKLAQLEPPDELLEADLLIDKAIALEGKGEYASTLAIYDQVEGMLRRNYGEQHPKLGAFMNNKGAALQAAGRYDEALPYHQSADAIAKRNGMPHRRVSALTNLCFAYNSAGQAQAGLSACELATEVCLQTYEALSDCAQATMALGNALASVGDGQAALAAYRQTFDGYAQVHAPDDPAMAWGWFSLADGYHAAGEWVEAEAAYRRTLELGQGDALAPSDRAEIAWGRAKVARGRGDVKAAERLGNEAVRLYREAQLEGQVEKVERWLVGG